MFWDESQETLPHEALADLQMERLGSMLARLKESVPFYQHTLRDILPKDIRTLDDIRQLPFTTKDDLRDHYPFGLLAVPLTEVVRLHASSGTTGRATVVGYSRKDMDLWADVMARTMKAGGVTPADVVHNAYGYGLFTGGLGFGLGAETVGAATVPVSSGMSKRQLQLLEDLGATVLCCTPSYGLALLDSAEASGIDWKKRMRTRIGFMGAEPWTDSMRQEISARMGIEAFDIYGLSEVIGPGVAVECSAHDGLHIWDDHFLPEVIDPESGEPASEGEVGELVFTTLTKEALPLLRYRTRDRVRLKTEPCSCGRTSVRMSKVFGRTDDMLIIRGVNVFPSQIEAALLAVDGLAPHYLILVDRQEKRLDDIEVRVEPTATTNIDREHLAATARDRVQQTLGIKVGLRVVEPGSLERSQGKAVRVVDRRAAED